MASSLRSVGRKVYRKTMGPPLDIPKDAGRLVEFRGARIHCNTANKLEDKLLKDAAGYDKANFTAVTSIVGPGAVVLDVGANIGIYSSVMSGLVGETGQVHAFEPVRHIRRKARLNIAMNGGLNVTMNAFALGDAPGELEMMQVKEGVYRGGASTFVQNNNIKAMGADKFDREKVRISTIDEYCAGFARLDFVKMDIEGFELNALRGARATMQRLRPAILFEHDKPRLGGLGLDEADFASLFADAGYTCFEIFLTDDAPTMAGYAFDRKMRGNNLLALALGD